MNTKDNPFNIPDLNPMYEKVRDYVKEKQGDKGFIVTDDDEKDTIWPLVYVDSLCEPREYAVKAVRVNEHGALQLIYDEPSVSYDEKAVSEADEDKWYDVMWDDNVYYIPTIFNIAENIREYA